MYWINDTLKNICRTVIFTAVSFTCITVYGQGQSSELQESEKKTERTNTLAFYDSLEVKAGKSRFGQKMYDLLVVKPDEEAVRSITTSSSETFNDYKGRIIRNIEIRRLNVFGTDINNLDYQDQRKLYNFINKTHVRTNEQIIRKNLLFNKGEEISPLTLGDNERFLRQLPFIEDARILIIPVSDTEADIVVAVKDIYSLGIDYSFKSLDKGMFKLFERNLFGIGHAIEFVIPYDSYFDDSPGFGANYIINNIGHTFTDLQLNYADGLGRRTYGINLSRDFLSAETKYAGGILIRKTYTTVDLDTLPVPEPLEYGFQDYWAARSFLLNEESVTRLIIGARYTRNNIFTRPEINDNSYHSLQNYKQFLGSVSLSFQKFYKTSLIYNYGRTEDIPYGGLIRFTGGREFNEFKIRTYLGADVSIGKSFRTMGYYYLNAGYATYLNGNQAEQGLFNFKLNHFSNLYKMGSFQIRNFLDINYIKGISRYTDEYLLVNSRNGMSGFSNDSIRGTERLMINMESVVFSPVDIYGFRFSFFGFVNMALLRQSAIQHSETFLSGIGIGVRIRNDNLVLKTFQIRLGYFPNPPIYSNLNYFRVSGEQVLKPANFESGPPEVFGFR